MFVVCCRVCYLFLLIVCGGCLMSEVCCLFFIVDCVVSVVIVDVVDCC